ncbi:hypothetical protein GOPIP_079_00130 [Gordonia polyisoprenivorans NBRC 16320 = JCM 10675]|nr:hypothetical protein GOPIP_079_00130 [Gordonia polyisoprenivorans NBRC 16320 = JCM 10675]
MVAGSAAAVVVAAGGTAFCVVATVVEGRTSVVVVTVFGATAGVVVEVASEDEVLLHADAVSMTAKVTDRAATQRDTVFIVTDPPEVSTPTVGCIARTVRTNHVRRVRFRGRFLRVVDMRGDDRRVGLSVLCPHRRVWVQC